MMCYTVYFLILERDQRIVLQPGDLVRCKYTFSPKIEGNFNLKRYVEVKGWPASQVVITVGGICDVPRLDLLPNILVSNPWVVIL